MKELVISLLICFMMKAQDSTALKPWDNLRINSEYNFQLSPSIQIAELCRISWKDGVLDITYTDSTKVTEAVKKFFDWVKGYMENDYYVLDKKDYQFAELFTDGWSYKMYFKLKEKK